MPITLTWGDPQDVRDRWVGDTSLSASDDTLKVLLSDAEDLIVREFPDLPSRVPAPVPLGRVKRVLARMVIRVLRNPDGLRMTQETGGPFSQQLTFAGYNGDDPGGLYLTDMDRADLTSEGGKTAFMIDTVPALPLSYGSDPTRWLTYGGTWYE